MSRAQQLLWASVAVALAGCAAPEGEPVRTEHVVIPGPWVFEPAAIQVTEGSNVTFENRGGAAHSVTFGSLGIDFDLAPGESRDVTFAEAGEFAYVCKYHPPDMRGRVVVEAAGETANASTETTW